MPTSNASSAAASDNSSVAGKPFPEQRRHGAPLSQREPEIPPHGVAGEPRELHVERLVETQIGAQAHAVFDRRILADHERHRIAREVEEAERDEGHDRHDRGGLHHAAKDEGKHGAAATFALAAVRR